MSKKFWEVEVSNNEETVSALFDSVKAARAYADDCSDIRGVTMVYMSGPYRVFSNETVHIAYVRTWKIFSQLKGENV